MTEYTALTIWQPWATLIAYEVKLYEFRSRAAPRGLVGKRIAIHAGARKPNLIEIRALLVKLHSDRWRETGMVRSKAIELLDRMKDDYDSLPRGSVVCTAVLGAPLPPRAVAERIGTNPELTGNWAWPMQDIRRIEPSVPAKGQQGFWKVNIEEDEVVHG